MNTLQSAVEADRPLMIVPLMSRAKAIVTPSVMKWARERARLDIAAAAKKIGRPEADIEGWESGACQPSIAQARSASKVYKRSLAVFYLPAPPVDFATLEDFRTLQNATDREYSHELALLIQRLHARQEWMRDFLQFEGGVTRLEFVGIAAGWTSESRVAASIKQTLKVESADQIACGSAREALNLWIEKAEACGIYVCREGKIDPAEVRGILLADEVAPFIYVNSNDSNAARLFTLVHELAHLWINRSGISNLEGTQRTATRGSAAIEVFCNRVANLALMDTDEFQRRWKVRKSSQVLLEQILAISKHFNVSGEVVARRLRDNRVLSTGEYETIRDQLKNRWIDFKEQELKKRKDSDKPGGPTYYVQKIHANGRGLTQTVIGGCNSGAVTLRDACAVLGVKVGHLPTLAEKAGIKQAPAIGQGVTE